ncbi:hypothetical protein Q5P01_015549 [Channa striata]|uniref:Uncharacterized protein n=1 Tax=Channa striata TaxID=64152 RepID=A0AA88MCE9_CHASR|nr:hypothetical protein Q5P01_015549 [Channa striata]
MNWSCFRSSDPAAENFRLVYDFNSDDENLCIRDDPRPPPLCGSSAPAPDQLCLVCRSGGLVYTWIRDLARGADVQMEALGDVPLKSSGKRTFSLFGQNRTLGGNSLSDDPTQQLGPVTIFIIVLLTVIVLVGIIIIYAVRKCQRRRRQQPPPDRAAVHPSEDETEDEAEAETAV